MSAHLQAALDAISQAEAEPIHKATAAALIKGWHDRWQGLWSEYEVLEVEGEFSFPLLNPETEGESKTFVEAGKMDVLLKSRQTGSLVVVEHKTTSDDLDGSSDYWDRLLMDTQISKYLLATHHIAGERATVLYDVTRKPSIRPCQVPILDEAGLKIVQDQNGQRVMNANGKPRQTGDTEKGYTLQSRLETAEEYQARLESDVASRPDRYFAQREVARTDSHILEYMEDAWALSQQLLHYRRRNLWPRNPGACAQFGKCEYFDICAGRVGPVAPWYQQRIAKHSELELTSPKDLLTNSLLGTLRTCARKYKLRYEDQIEAVSGEGKDALKFGTLYHAALEAYFLSLKDSNPNQA